MTRTIHTPNEESLIKIGQQLAGIIQPGDHIYLEGHLGAGKTTLVRSLLRALGVTEIIKSPTYTLVESYYIEKNHFKFSIHHFDFYRIKDIHELETMGFRDYFTDQTICLIEWPENAEEILPTPSLYFKITMPLTGTGRDVLIAAHSKRGNEILSHLVV